MTAAENMKLYTLQEVADVLPIQGAETGMEYRQKETIHAINTKQLLQHTGQ